MTAMPQRRLSHELRYLIDMAKRGGREVDLDKIRVLVADNPRAMRSEHVLHNLGLRRMLWLGEKGIIQFDPETYRVRT